MNDIDVIDAPKKKGNKFYSLTMLYLPIMVVPIIMVVMRIIKNVLTERFFFSQKYGVGKVLDLDSDPKLDLNLIHFLLRNLSVVIHF
jgi:hypothetical protein